MRSYKLIPCCRWCLFFFLLSARDGFAQFWFGDNGPAHIETVAKIFDATETAASFCTLEAPFERYMSNTRKGTSFLNGINMSEILNLLRHPRSEVGRHVASGMATLPSWNFKSSPKEISLTQLVPIGVPRVFEDIILSSLFLQVGQHLISVIGTKNDTLLTQLNLTPLLKPIGESTNGDTGRKVSLGVVEDVFVPVPLMDILTTQTMASLVECLISDSKWEMSLLWRSITTKLSGRKTNIGHCLCKSVEWGFLNDDGNQKQCTLLNYIETGLICGADLLESAITSVCQGVFTKPIEPYGFSSCTHTEASGSLSPNPNKDFDLFLHTRSEVMPSGETEFPLYIPRGIQEQEGLTYYFLYRANLNALKYAALSLCGAEDIKEVVPGWKTELLLDVRQEGEKIIKESGRGSINLGVVARRNCEILVVVRGTSSAFEWRLDFTYSYMHGKYHQGFASLAMAIYPSLSVYISHIHSSSECESSSQRVILTGHSLGGGVVTVLGHLLAGDGYRGNVAVVTFAAPQSLSPQAAEEFDRTVNARMISSEFDAITGLPCTDEAAPHGLMACELGHVRNGPSDVRPIFKAPRGRINISSKALGDLSSESRWTNNQLADVEIKVELDLDATIKGRILDSANMQFIAYHLNSYACWSGQFCSDPKKETWMCSDNTKEDLPPAINGEPVFLGYDVDLTIPLSEFI